MKRLGHNLSIAEILTLLVVTTVLSCAVPGRVSLQEAEDVWSTTDFARHIQALNGSNTAGQRSGTLQYAAASNHIVGQYRASGLHPGINTFTVPFFLDRNNVSDFKISASRQDSLRVLPGIDAAPVPWTGTGERKINRFSNGIPLSNVDLAETAIVVDKAKISREFLRRLRALPNPTVFAIGDLSYETSSHQVDSAVAIQITRESFGRLLGVSTFGVQSILNSPSGRIFNFRESVDVLTESSFVRRVQESNIIGILPGKAPAASSELIILVASFGSGGEFGGLPTYRFADLGIGSSVLLQVSSQVASDSRYRARPDRSIMFAHVYTGDEEKKGIESFFRSPVWSMSSVSSIFLIGLSDADTNIFMSYASAFAIDVQRFDAIAPDEMDGAGFLSHPRWVEHTLTRSSAVRPIDRRILTAAKDSAAVEALRLGNNVMSRLNELMVDPESLPYLERNAQHE